MNPLTGGRWRIVSVALFCALSARALLYAQTGGMLNPVIDSPGEPFSYFWHPNDTIGALFAPVATEVTPEGYLYTGFGELMFLVGNPPEPVNQRVKTLYKGYLPIVHSRSTPSPERSGLWTFFSAVSPDWFQPGKVMEAVSEPTEFGTVIFCSRTSSATEAWNWTVELSNHFHQPPAHLAIRIPWFYEVQRAEADGCAADAREGHLVVDPGTKELRVKGRIRPGSQQMNFDQAVRCYKEEYRRRYEEFLRTGVTWP